MLKIACMYAKECAKLAIQNENSHEAQWREWDMHNRSELVVSMGDLNRNAVRSIDRCVEGFK